MTTLPEEAKVKADLADDKMEFNNFSQALALLKAGYKIKRAMWLERFVCMMPPLELPPSTSTIKGPKVNERTAKFIGINTPLNCKPYFVLYVAHNNTWQPGWLASQEDILAEDWMIVE